MSEPALQPSWKWRGVLFVSRLISFIAAPLHSLHWKILLLHLAVLVLPGAWFAIHERAHLREAAVPGLIGFAAAIALAYLLSAYLTRIIRDLAKRARRIAEGEPDVPLETWTQSELGELARALEQMRRKIEGRAYVEEMVVNLSHELKTPLAAIRGAAELLEGGANLDSAARLRFLANIQSEVQRLDQLVNNLLTLSRIETLPVAPEAASTNATPIARELAAIYGERALAAGVSFQTEIAAEALPVSIPGDSLRLLLSNLLDNALRFTAPSQSIALRLERHTLTVRDTGAGIEPELLPKIFDRFFTTENPRTGERGSGLGLAMVKAVADRHHARIHVESAPGEGTVFIVELPAIS